jgi:hypothetical protein
LLPTAKYARTSVIVICADDLAISVHSQSISRTQKGMAVEEPEKAQRLN